MKTYLYLCFILFSLTTISGHSQTCESLFQKESSSYFDVLKTKEGFPNLYTLKSSYMQNLKKVIRQFAHIKKKHSKKILYTSKLRQEFKDLATHLFLEFKKITNELPDQRDFLDEGHQVKSLIDNYNYFIYDAIFSSRIFGKNQKPLLEDDLFFSLVILEPTKFHNSDLVKKIINESQAFYDKHKVDSQNISIGIKNRYTLEAVTYLLNLAPQHLINSSFLTAAMRITTNEMLETYIETIESDRNLHNVST